MKTIITSLSLGLLAACGSDSAPKSPSQDFTADRHDDDAVEATNTGRRSKLAKNTASAKAKNKSKQTENDDELDDLNKSEDDPHDHDDIETSDPRTQSKGEKYFTSVVLPIFEAECRSCHADPRMNPVQKGPLSIFSYAAMRTWLLDGSSSGNRLAAKVRNTSPHGGGNRCLAGPTASPCLELTAWWVEESGKESSFDGAVTSVSLEGDVIGYAVDPKDTTSSLTVRLLVDGAFAVETLANVVGADNNYPGDHAFKAKLPIALRDGKPHKIGISVGENSVGNLKDYTAYAPKDAGKQFYTDTVAPALQNRCGGCHAIQYEVQYGALLSPAPHQGGSAISNSLINYSAGANNHPGGNVCGNRNNPPCNLLQMWWNLEFGP